MRVVNDVVGTQPVVLIYSAEPCVGTVPGLGADIVDAAAVYIPAVDGRMLSFYLEGDRVLDRETGSAWNATGAAVDGPLKGRQLEALASYHRLLGRLGLRSTRKPSLGWWSSESLEDVTFWCI